MSESPAHEVDLEIQTAEKKPRKERFFWTFYCVYGILLLALVAMQGNPLQYIVYLLWFLPVFLVKFYQRIATVLAMIPIVILWSLYIYIFVLRFVFMTTHRAEGPNVGDSPVAFLGIWAMEIIFVIMPLSILLISGTRALIRCFKEAKPVAAPVNCGQQVDGVFGRDAGEL